MNSVSSFPDLFVGKCAVGIERLRGPCDVELLPEPRARPESTENGQPRGLPKPRASYPRRSSHEGNRLVAEDPRLLELLDDFRNAMLTLQVAVVEWDACDRAHFYPRLGWGKLHGCTQESGVE